MAQNSNQPALPAGRRVANAVRLTIQGTGVLAGVFGIGMLGAAGFAAYHAFVAPAIYPTTILMLLSFFGMGSYLIYIASLVTWGYSPAAVRHFCGALTVVAFGLFMYPIMIYESSVHDIDSVFPNPSSLDLAILFGVIAFSFACRAAGDCFHTFLFPYAQPTQRVP